MTTGDGRLATPILPQAAAGECLALLGPDAGDRSALLARLSAKQNRRGPILIARDDPLFPQLDVAGNVRFPLRGRPDHHRKGSELIAIAGLEAVAGRSVRGLDPTMRARALLARAFATCRPLVLDDPFGGLPSHERSALQILLRRLTRQCRAPVVLAGADRTEAFACGDRIGVIENGLVERVDTIPSMLAAPGSAFAARMLLDAELLAGRVATDAGEDDDADVFLSCGTTMQARLSDRVGPGDLCLVAIRPDQIAFASMRAADLGGNSLAATMIDVHHFSDHVRLRLRLEDGSHITVRRPAASLTPRDIARASEHNGASLAWRSSDAVAYPHPQA